MRINKKEVLVIMTVKVDMVIVLKYGYVKQVITSAYSPERAVYPDNLWCNAIPCFHVADSQLL